jgi:hypothetical protein
MTLSRNFLSSRIKLAALVLAHFGLAVSATAFEAGEVFWAPGGCDSPCGVFDITGGGSITAGHLVGATQSSPGQVAWSTDFQTLYITQFDTDAVLEISNAGVASSFATGIDGATGLLRVDDGRLLAVSYWTGVVFDISAGGDFSSAVPFATGFDAPRNLLQLASGQILLADQGLERVFDITNGGDSTAAQGFAYGFSQGPYDLVQDDAGRIFASTRGPVFNITSGGDFSGAAAFAYGVNFIGLAVDGDQRLLGGEFNSGEVFDISAGGDFSAATAFAQNAPGFGDTALDSIRGVVAPPPAVPALGRNSLVLLAVCLGALGMQLSSRASRSKRVSGRIH